MSHQHVFTQKSQSNRKSSYQIESLFSSCPPRQLSQFKTRPPIDLCALENARELLLATMGPPRGDCCPTPAPEMRAAIQASLGRHARTNCGLFESRTAGGRAGGFHGFAVKNTTSRNTLAHATRRLCERNRVPNTSGLG